MLLKIKTAILSSFGLVVAVLGRAGAAVAVAALSAQALKQADGAAALPFARRFLAFESALEKPVVSFLHASVPCSYYGIDAAPYAFAASLILLWILCETELHRLARAAWYLQETRRVKESEKKAVARRKRESQQAELLRLAVQAREEERLREASAKPAAPAAAPQGDVPSSQREQLLELYAQTKKTLEEQKKNLSFLAVDVVDSTGMKQGEDAALAERDFRQYRKVVERVIAEHKGLKAAWTPDGVMICFASVQNAVQAAQELIRSLDRFNREVKTIKADFKVRCGVNAGRVLFDDSVRMEEMSDRNIDIAGHMQKYAEPNTIFIGAHAIEGMRAQLGFSPAHKQVDGCEVYEWRSDGAAEAARAE